MYNIHTPPPKNMTLYVLDDHLEHVGQIRGFSSLQMTRSLFGVGSFSLHVPLTKNNLEALQIGRYICLGNSDARCAIIGNAKIKSARGKDNLEVSGYMLKGLVNKRIIVPPTLSEVPGSYGWEGIETSPAELVLRHFFGLQLVSSRNPARNVELLELEPLHDPPRGMQTPWYALHKDKLAQVLKDICEFTKMGYDIRLDMANKKMVFVCIDQRDLSKSGGASPVIFSRSIGNLLDYDFEQRYKDYTNTAYIAGAGKDEEQLVLSAYFDEDGQRLEMLIKGVQRAESWISAGNIDDPQKLYYEGEHKYESQRKLLRTVKAQVMDTQAFRYGYEWDIGDRVSIMMYPASKQVTLDAQITQVTETYERGNMRLDVVFGDELPTILSELNAIRKERE